LRNLGLSQASGHGEQGEANNGYPARSVQDARHNRPRVNERLSAGANRQGQRKPFHYNRFCLPAQLYGNNQASARRKRAIPVRILAFQRHDLEVPTADTWPSQSAAGLLYSTKVNILTVSGRAA
jgi:hypothetical protein